RRAWLLDLVEVPNTALPELAQRMDAMESSTSVKTFAEFPEALPKLASLRVGERLARTLRGGLFGELFWPDFEALCEELSAGAGNDSLFFSGPFPYLVVSDQRRAVVLGPKGRVLEHDLQLPKNAKKLRYLAYVDGQLLVVYRDAQYNDKGYWSDAPKKKLDINMDFWADGTVEGRQLPLVGGGVHTGDGKLSVGDSKIPGFSKLFFDGENSWKTHYDDKLKRYVLVEFDPETGKKGRKSSPRFLEDFATANNELLVGFCELTPAPEGLEQSPLGLADGMLGWRTCRDDKRQVMERIDGVRSDVLLEDDGRVPDAILSLPSGEALGVDAGYVDHEDLSFTYDLWCTDGSMVFSRLEQSRDNQPTTPILPMNYWHFYRARDVEGSKALRQVKDEQVAVLLATCVEELAQEGDAQIAQPVFTKKKGKKKAVRKKAAPTATVELPQTSAKVAELWPGISDAGLRHQVVMTVAEAGKLENKLQELTKTRDPENPAAKAQEAQPGDDGGEKIRKQLGILIDSSWNMEHLFPQLRALDAFFSDGVMSEPPGCDASWYNLLGQGIGAAAFLAPTASLDDKERGAWLDLLTLWAGSIFCTRPDALRVREMKLKRTHLPFQLPEDDCYQAGLGEYAGDRYFLWDVDPDEDEQQVSVVQFSDGGTFELLPGAKLKGDTRYSSAGWATSEKLLNLVAVVRERGVRPFVREHAEALAEKSGLSYAEAALLMAGLPQLDTWGKNFLPKALREEMGLKVAEADVARQSFKDLGDAKLRKLFDLAMPAEPEGLYASAEGELPAFIPRLAKAVVKVMGKRLQLDTALLMTMDKDLQTLANAKSMLPALAEPKKDKRLTNDGRWEMGEYGGVEDCGNKTETFDMEMMATVSGYVSYIHSALPVGHLLGQKLVELVELARTRTKTSTFLVDGPHFHAGNLKKNEAFVEALGGKEFRPKDLHKKAQSGRDNGWLIALADPDGDGVNLAFRPGKIKNWAELCKLGTDESWSWQGFHRARAAELLLSERMLQIAKRTLKSPLAEGSYEANPLNSVPKLVAEVAQTHDVSEEAACLYLQLLALPNPSDKKLREFNGW
ncbi:MAG: hypothetical protein JRH20_27660, partial [Deltaproteobacteria bacterium]|nr:hypothetical protein [Deltaproteobacteria bacterium]